MTFATFVVRPRSHVNSSTLICRRHLSLLDHDRPLQPRLLPLVVPERDAPAAELVESLERVDQVSVERIAAELAVGDDVEAGGLLQRDGLGDRAILDRLELRVGERAGGASLLRVEQVGGPQQAADDVASEHDELRAILYRRYARRRR